jgi:hypothetical protein
MNVKERIMAALRHEEPDVVPVTVYTLLLPRGKIERELRNMGLGLVEFGLPVYGIESRKKKVKMQTTEELASFSPDDRMISLAKQKHPIQRTYSTPVGSVSEKYKWGYTLVEWPFEWAIKDLQDYETVKYIIDDVEYFANYDDFTDAIAVMGQDGIVLTQPAKSPLQCMIYELMGYKRFAVDYRMHREEFDELYRLLYKKQLEMYRIIADSPAEVVLLGDNITGVVTNPVLFEKYCMPFYDDVADILHKKGKIVMNHFDGKLMCLRDLIARTKIDVIEAFTPPPIGDLPIEEARATWAGKVLWANFPATVYLETGLVGVEQETMRMLRSAAPGDSFLLGITEDIGDILSIGYAEALKTFTATAMKYGTYPINMEA